MAAHHLEYRYKAANSHTVVVFIHGILGSPLQFNYMIDKLEGVYCVENLLLPGHGGTVGQFAASSMLEWQAYVDDRVRRLERDYQNIFLVGHSMGCLLAVQTALSYPDKICGLFLLAAPLVIRVRSPYVRSLMVAALQKNNISQTAEAAERAQAAVNSNSVRTERSLVYLTALPRFLDLYLKSRKTRPQVGMLRFPMIVVQSEHDETVSIKSLRYFDEMPNVSILIAKDSGHFYYPKETKELLSDALLHFIKEHSQERQASPV